jgi:hypothetical protein
VQSRFGISGVELGDDHHTALPLFFVTPTPLLGPSACGVGFPAWDQGEERVRQPDSRPVHPDARLAQRCPIDTFDV